MPRKGAPSKNTGKARQLKSAPETKHGRKTGYFLARYIDLEGRTRQAGRHTRKSDANDASLKKVNELNSKHATPGGEITLTRWHEIWPKRIRRDQRTIKTNQHRVSKYILPHLPGEGDLPIDELERSMLYDVQTCLLEAGYAKSTIDGAFSSLSAVLGVVPE